ncbi:MAG: TonB-dependent receptor [Gemmatimonadaceae bacterium]|nr:TonB-dependent receptor [Gemmatimonadaceae bacterium]
MLPFIVRRLLPAAASLLFAATAAAQSGSLTGRITTRDAGRPLDNARVTVAEGARVVGVATSGESGQYTLPNIAAGTYTVSVSRIGFRLQRFPGTVVRSGQATTVNAGLEEVPTQLNAVVTSVSRRQEKALDAPASVAVISTEAIERRPSITVADHVRGTPGVDVSAGGIAQSNIVARGFNNAFSGSLLTLQDYRFAGVPSLRVNVPFLATGTNEDIDRIELLLGPASALYGPNSSAGVLHVITKSPFTSQGTTLTIDGGERSVFRGGIRHAGAVGGKFGYKVSGEYFTGDDWHYNDPGEPDSVSRRLTDGAAPVRVANQRDFLTQRYAGEARIDWRPRDGMELVSTYGLAHINNAVELTGANGAAQIRNWSMQTLQQRFRWNRFFGQVFANLSNAGNADSLSSTGTFLLRTGGPIVDLSRVVAGQLQHGASFGPLDLVYGLDYIWTNPRTGGTINGANEERDNVTEQGGYVQGRYQMTKRLELLTALRLDQTNVIKGTFVSPRAALQWKPEPNSTARLVYNRAFSTPGNFSFFLDLPQGRNAFSSLVGTVRSGLGAAGALVPGAPFNYDVIANGNPPKAGFQYDRSCTGAGFGSFCMRSSLLGSNAPVAASAAAAFPALATAMTPALRAVLAASLTGSLGATGAGIAANAIMTRLSTATPTNAQISTRATLDVAGTLLRGVPGVQPAAVRDLGALGAAFNDTYEIGYKGLSSSGKLSFDVSSWYQRRGDVAVTAALATPTVLFGSPTELGTYIGGQAAAALAGSGLPLTPLQIQTIAGNIAPSLAAAMAPLPLGTVTFNNASIVSNGNLRATYQRLDKIVEVFGTDIGLSYALSDKFSLDGTASVVSNIIFVDVQVGPQPFALNAPGAKGSLTSRYSNAETGWGGEVRYRYTNAFPVNSGVYVSGQPLVTTGTVVGRDANYTYNPVPVNNLFDVGISKRFGGTTRRALTWSLNVTNLFDRRVPTFAGTPAIGRLAMSRISATF